ncbi:MAG: metallophosphoesterase [Candidatus Aenigmarchaeota archaeon]|nr:metallophosphoesterase [Candidatus Aenigmarchaeota archaeon]
MTIKVLVVGDLHGNKPNIYFKDFDAIIAPGDFCSDSPRKYMFQALRKKLKNPECKTEWYDYIGKREARKMIEKSLSDGRKVLEYLNSFGIPVYVVPGNWDWTKDENSDWNFLRQDHYNALTKELSNIVDVHYRIIDIRDYQIIGYGISSGPEYPQYKEDLEKLKPKELAKRKREYERDLKEVSSLFEKASKPIIFLSHNVPFNTSIDKIKDKKSPRYGYHYGSLIVRKMIDEYQPLVCIGGHMHENFGKCKIGETTCINAGFGSYVNVWLELSEDKIKKLKFHKGEHD